MEKTGENTNPKIFAAIAGVIADVGSVAKDKVNKQQGFKYRSVDDVFNALHPALAKNKVFIVPRILKQSRETVAAKNGTKMTLVICDIKFTFYAEDGSHVEAVITGEGLDTGDKATNKAMAIAYKYACFQVFCIPTEDMVDPDGERPELEEDVTPAEKKTAGRKTPDKKPEVQKKEQENKAPEIPEDGKITKEMLDTIRSEQKRTGIKDSVILSIKTVKTKNLEELTLREYEAIMKKFKVTPDLKKEEGNE